MEPRHEATISKQLQEASTTGERPILHYSEECSRWCAALFFSKPLIF